MTKITSSSLNVEIATFYIIAILSLNSSQAGGMFVCLNLCVWMCYCVIQILQLVESVTKVLYCIRTVFVSWCLWLLKFICRRVRVSKVMWHQTITFPMSEV